MSAVKLLAPTSAMGQLTWQVLSSSQGSLASVRLVLSGFGVPGGHSAAPGVACEFACCFAYSYPQTSVWVGSSMAESAEPPGWALSWHLSSPGGPALPQSSCSILSALASALSALGVLRTKWLELKSLLPLSTNLLTRRTEDSLEVTLTPVRLK